jgi:hypothetical protein
MQKEQEFIQRILKEWQSYNLFGTTEDYAYFVNNVLKKWMALYFDIILH